VKRVSKREILRRLEAVEKQLATAPAAPLPGQHEIPIPGHPTPETTMTGLPCTECDHPPDQHGEGDDPVSPGECAGCLVTSPDDAWHDYQPARPGIRRLPN
jgi:hypothetical protein